MGSSGGCVAAAEEEASAGARGVPPACVYRWSAPPVVVLDGPAIGGWPSQAVMWPLTQRGERTAGRGSQRFANAMIGAPGTMAT
jgi:hypothetical protein